MRTRKSDEKFIQLYNSYIDEIYQFAYLRTGFDKQQAEDLTQDIFLQVFKSLNNFKGLCSERTWIYKIARNKVNDFYRSQYKFYKEHIDIESDEVAAIADISQDVEIDLMREYDKQRILECLDSIPKHYKLVLTLKYIDELSTKKIALLFGKTDKSIENMLRRAKQAYIKRYSEYEEDLHDK